MQNLLRKECRIAMQSSVPPHPRCACWNFDGALVELVEDIEQIVRDKLELSPGLPLENEENSLPSTVLGVSRPHSHPFVKRIKAIWRDNKWIRWALSQSALLFVNYAQSEMVSRNTHKAMNSCTNTNKQTNIKAYMLSSLFLFFYCLLFPFFSLRRAATQNVPCSC